MFLFCGRCVFVIVFSDICKEIIKNICNYFVAVRIPLSHSKFFENRFTSCSVLDFRKS